MTGNSNSLIELIKAVSSSGAQQQAPRPSGPATDAKNPGLPLSGNPGDQYLEFKDRSFVSPIPPELLEGYGPNTQPLAPGGALECLSVTQIAGPPAGGLDVPVPVRIYAVRGAII